MLTKLLGAPDFVVYYLVHREEILWWTNSETSHVKLASGKTCAHKLWPCNPYWLILSRLWLLRWVLLETKYTYTGRLKNQFSYHSFFSFKQYRYVFIHQNCYAYVLVSYSLSNPKAQNQSNWNANFACAAQGCTAHASPRIVRRSFRSTVKSCYRAYFNINFDRYVYIN